MSNTQWNTQWDENVVLHERVTYRLDEMPPAELYALGESLRAAVAQIESQLDDGRIIRSPEDEEWRRRALTAREIKSRQAEHIDDLLIAQKSASTRRERELSMSEALGRVVGRGVPPIGRTAQPPATVTQTARATADYFVMAARVVLHPSMFAAIEEQAQRLQASEAGR